MGVVHPNGAYHVTGATSKYLPDGLSFDCGVRKTIPPPGPVSPTLNVSVTKPGAVVGLGVVDEGVVDDGVAVEGAAVEGVVDDGVVDEGVAVEGAVDGVVGCM